MMGYYGYGNGYYCGYGNGMMSNGWSWIMMFGIVIILTIAVIGFIRYFRSPNSLVPVNNSNSAALILDERYARGEINTEEYQHRKALLTKN